MLAMDGITRLAQPWADLYSGSPALQSTVTFAHLGALVVAGGLALAADRSVWRALRRPAAERGSLLPEFAATHRPVVIGLAVLVLGGVALALADVATFATSWLFWVKMAAFALLLLNGLSLQRAEKRLAGDPVAPAAWRALRAGAVRSSALWGVTILLGVLLANNA